ncbi:hypothetical protein JCM11491_006052 [Sporobolomyces phaffii]
MTSIASLIGLDRSDLSESASVLAHRVGVAPEDYPSFARDAKLLGQDVRVAYADALATKHDQEKIQDGHFLERAKEFVELRDQVESSTQLLTQLADFLATFQQDLSAVSGHIAELQTRSKTIEGRLEARKAVERSLEPFLEAITIPPTLITMIVDTPVSSAWIPAVVELDAKLGAIRGGARVASRKLLDDTAESLRVAATTKILAHLNSLLRPFTTVISTQHPIAELHRTLVEFKPLFDFLRRHSARQAHDFEKNYTSTTRWYYETGFRRYVRTLEGIRVAAVSAASTTTTSRFRWDELVSSRDEANQASLALLNNAAKKRAAGGGTPVVPSALEQRHLSDAARSAILNSRLDRARGDVAEDDGRDEEEAVRVIPAWQTQDKSLNPSMERLFRSIMIVTAHNCAEAYRFLDAFFGSHSSLSDPKSTRNAMTSRVGRVGRMARLDSNGSLPTVSESEFGGGGAGSESGRTVTSTITTTTRDRDRDKLRRTLVEGLWKQVTEPALEYASNFVHALVSSPSPHSPSPLSLVSMIQLNDSILEAVEHEHDADNPDDGAGSSSECPPLVPHLYSIKLLVWPLYTKTIDAQTDALKRINGSPPPASTASTVGGLLGRMTGASTAGGARVKDSTVQAILERYVEWFVAIVEICAGRPSQQHRQRDAEGAPDADEPVFQLLLRLRTELDRLLVYQSRKIVGDDAKQRAFLRAGYQELLQGLSMGLTRHERIQREIAHYRELARTVQ